jgi:hypothetical protein
VVAVIISRTRSADDETDGFLLLEKDGSFIALASWQSWQKEEVFLMTNT